MDKNNSQQEKKPNPNPQIQYQPINELSRFGHSVTLRKKKIIIILFI